MNDNKPIIRSAHDLSFYCECGYALAVVPASYPVDLTKDNVELQGCPNYECRWSNLQTICVRLDQREVIYIKEATK